MDLVISQKEISSYQQAMFACIKKAEDAEIYCDAILRIVNEINLMRDVSEEMVKGRYQNALDNQNGANHPQNA